MPLYETVSYDTGAYYDAPATHHPSKKGRAMAGNPVPDNEDVLLALAEGKDVTIAGVS